MIVVISNYTKAKCIFRDKTGSYLMVKFKIRQKEDNPDPV